MAFTLVCLVSIGTSTGSGVSSSAVVVGASAEDVSIDASSVAIASTAVDSSNPTAAANVVSSLGASTRPSNSEFVVFAAAELVRNYGRHARTKRVPRATTTKTRITSTATLSANHIARKKIPRNSKFTAFFDFDSDEIDPRALKSD